MRSRSNLFERVSNQRRHVGEHIVQFFRVAPPCGGQLRPPTPPAAQSFPESAHEIPGPEHLLFDQIVGHGRNDGDLLAPLVPAPQHAHGPLAELVAQLLPQFLEVVHAGAVDPTGHDRQAIDVRAIFGNDGVELIGELPVAKGIDLFPERLPFLLELRDGIGQGLLERAELAAGLRELVELPIHVFQSRLPRHRLHAAHTRGH